jgi:hypothetical protein
LRRLIGVIRDRVEGVLGQSGIKLTTVARREPQRAPERYLALH